MEPLTALALAGNVVQFVEFVGGLLNKTCKIYASTSGLTPANHHVQEICGKLALFSVSLQPQALTSDGTTPASPQSQALKDCATACKRDCDDLLCIMRALADKGTKGPKHWRSFSAALAHTLKSGEIKDLRDRIADRQRLMLLQLCAVSNETVQLISDQLAQLKRSIGDWHTRSSAWLGKLSETEKSLQAQVARLTSHGSPNPADIESICSGLSRLSIETLDYQKAMRILDTLDYEERPARHAKIPEAHQATLAWSLKDTNADHQTSGSLYRWLRSDEGLFWVSGKPGSGKSTLMKFVADHQDTRKHLEQWCGPRRPVVLSHYFTIHGTPIQKSLEGLRRTLLFGILREEPKLTAELLPTRWDREATTSTQHQLPWTQSELESALQRITRTTALPVPICLFIDGLDEYTGDHLEICQTLKQMAKSPFIKICVSSRPWNDFEDSFGGSRRSKLYMHEVTEADIRDYTKSRLSEHPRWPVLASDTDVTAAKSLIDDVVVKSRGVFLWVFLVTRLLREGLSNDDTISDLMRRVSSFPADLHQFFRQILSSVDSFYHEKMAGMLLIARDADEPLPVPIFKYHELEYDDEGFALKEPTELLSYFGNQSLQLSLSVSRRINGMCKGFLELEAGGRRMVFLHRTVFDFLRTPEMSDFLYEKATRNFCPSFSTFKAWIAWIKRLQFPCVLDTPGVDQQADPFVDMEEFVSKLREALKHAHCADQKDGSLTAKIIQLLDNMETSMLRMLKRGQISMTDHSVATNVYRQLVLEAHITGHLKQKLLIPGYFKNRNGGERRSCLYFAMRLAPDRARLPISFLGESTRWLLKELLKQGHDPNKVCGSQNLWTALMGEHDDYIDYDNFCTALKKGFFDIMLEHGADPRVEIAFSRGDNLKKWKTPSWFRFLVLARVIQNRPLQEAYERVLNLMLNKIPSLGYARGYLQHTGDTAWNESDVWQIRYPGILSPILTQLPDGGEFLFTVTLNVLERLSFDLEGFVRAQLWFSTYLAKYNPALGEKVLAVKPDQSHANLRKRMLEKKGQGDGRETQRRKTRKLIH
ncbi:hypothetical protein FZEAL_5712 [Fusarium zealandicum]|uniref:NACHT domain-containing protein n=1 Tax=Fusarium zealandicum TaxID=1053134 RepID=A0A8H4XJI5_9HYPO|nr:hypothetical protein FZEAL_5712 [Fusarium zealandicum]